MFKIIKFQTASYSDFSIKKSFLAVLLFLFGIQYTFGEVKNHRTLVVKATTESYGGRYKPYNVSVIWITNQTGKCIKTIGHWAKPIFGLGYSDLKEWKASCPSYLETIKKMGNHNLDGTFTYGRRYHGEITGLWDLKDSIGNKVPNGTYFYNIEITENPSGDKIHVWGELLVTDSNLMITGNQGQNSGAKKYPRAINTISTEVLDYELTKIPPRVNKLSYIKENNITLEFFRPIDPASASKKENYSITYVRKNNLGQWEENSKKTLNIDSIKITQNNKLVNIYTEVHYLDEKYTIELGAIKDRDSLNLSLPKSTLTYIPGYTPFKKSIHIAKYFDLNAISVGDSIDTTFFLGFDPIDISEANFKITWGTLVDTTEVALSINGNRLYYPNSRSVGIYRNDSIIIDPTNLKKGMNQFAFHKTNFIPEKSKGVYILDLYFDYYVINRNREITPIKNISSINQKSQFGKTKLGNNHYMFFAPSEFGLKEVVIYNLQGEIIGHVYGLNPHWNHYKGLRDKKSSAIVYCKFIGTKGNQIKTLILK